MTGHSLDPELVEWVVCEVIRRLTDRGFLVQTDGANATDELVLTERVVTRASLEHRLDGIRQVVVGGNAIVTPAVRDDLSERRIELVRR